MVDHVASKKAPKRAPGILKPHERKRLMGATFCDERTIQRWERGEPVQASTRRVLDEAARRMDLPVPRAVT